MVERRGLGHRRSERRGLATASAIFQHTSVATLNTVVPSAVALISHNLFLMSVAALAPTVLSAAALISTQFSYTHSAPQLPSQKL